MRFVGNLEDEVNLTYLILRLKNVFLCFVIKVAKLKITRKSLGEGKRGLVGIKVFCKISAINFSFL